MRHLYFLFYTILICVVGTFTSERLAAQNTAGCPNADFSAGNFSNWNQRRGTTSGNGAVNWDGTKGNFEIISAAGADPNCPTLQMIPPGYTRAARINYNTTAGYSASELSYTMTVTAQNALFIYNYAVVFGDPNHSTAQQPWFNIAVTDSSNNLIPCTQYLVTIGANSSGYVNGNGINKFKPWTRVGVNLSAYIGQTITVRLSAGHCGAGASSHWAYAYIVAECQPMEIEVRYCIGDTTAVLLAPDGFETYTWQPGNISGQSLTIQNPQPGLSQYTVSLTSNGGQCQAQLNVIIDPVIPVADFDTLTICQQGAQFTDLSNVNRGSITQWDWDFGDGATSALQNPTHYYSAPGAYDVRLVNRTNIGCRDTIMRKVYVKPNPTADFSMSGDVVSVLDPNMYCAPGAIFSDQSTHIAPWDDSLSVVAWLWDFGGGNTSNLQNPTYNFPTEGSHTITLIATDNRGCHDTIVKNWVNNRPPVADFGVPPLCGLTGVFTDQSIDTSPNGSIVGWQWNFGDAGTSSSQNPSHTYAGQGDWSVTLIATDAAGCQDTITKPFRNNEFPVADIILPQDCGLSQVFTDNSSDPRGEPLSWEWAFGDGGNSTQQHPTHGYAQEAIWNVQLIVTDTAGCKDTIIVQHQSKEIPVADFDFNNVCFGVDMPFTDLSTAAVATIDQWNWDFGSGQTSVIQNPLNDYPGDGDFNVRLIATTTLGCSDTIQKVVTVHPLPIVNFTVPAVCNRHLTSFTNLSTIPLGTIDAYLWNFGAPVAPSNLTNPTLVYPNDGTFNVQLIATSNWGCRDSITKPVTIHPIPNVDFTAGPLMGCYPFNVSFTNGSTINLGSINSYTWTFGDGNTSNSTNTNYVYPNTDALYTVSLYAVSDKGCDTLITKTNYIRVWHKPTADFSYNPSHPKITDPLVHFNNLSVAADSYQWYFEDGLGSSSLFEPFYLFPADTGLYNVELVAITVNGCTDTIMRTVHIGPDYMIYVPNSFTPNGDKLNDVFKVMGAGINNSTLMIFNRWGNPIITLTNNQAIDIGWDGTYQGEIVKQDVYSYKLEVIDLNNKKHTYFGNINVIR